jgi:hypothetical protein
MFDRQDWKWVHRTLPLMWAYTKAVSLGHYFIYYSPQTYQSHQKLHQQPLQMTQQ